MIKVKILVENTKADKAFKAKHGLSFYIEYNGKSLILDLGADDKFLYNSTLMNVDVSSVEMLILSHNHVDHTGGLDAFCKVNQNAEIYMFGNVNDMYYTKIAKVFNYPISLKCSQITKERITSLTGDHQLNDCAYFIRNSVNKFPKPSLNKALYMRNDGNIKPDTFQHEGILVLIDNNELIIFNSCSHNGVINSIETVKEHFLDKKVRAYIGGFHFCNPISKQHATDEELRDFSNYFLENEIKLFTGHCTGEYSFNYLKTILGNKLNQIYTGLELEV